MKILNKFIWSKKEPKNKNDIWFDGSTWRMYTEEAWQSFTLPVDAADKVAKVLENASEVYQEKLDAGYGIVIEGNTISVDNNILYDDGDVWEAIETLQQNKVDKTKVATINGQSLINGGNIEIEGNNDITFEEVASTEPTAEFPQVLYTAQTLTESQKAQARKNIGVGEGGGSIEGGVELVEFIENPLSEEDKAINAASYAKMVAGGNYIPYVKVAGAGGNLDVSFWGIDEEGLYLVVDSYVLPLMGAGKHLLAVFSEGHTMQSSLGFLGQILFTEDLVTYEAMKEKAIELVGEVGFNTSPIRVVDTDGFGWVDEIIVQGDYVFLIYTTDYGVKYQILGYGGTINSVTKEIIAGGTIYLGVTDPTSEEAKNNKMVNLAYGMTQTFNIKVVNEDTRWFYTPLMIKSGAVIICRNGTMEGWIINSDGTTTLSQ